MRIHYTASVHGSHTPSCPQRHSVSPTGRYPHLNFLVCYVSQQGWKTSLHWVHPICKTVCRTCTDHRREERKESKNKLCGSYLKTVTWFSGERQISTGRVPRKLETDMRTCTALTPSSGIEPPGGILPHLAMESNHTHTMLSVVYLCTFSTIYSTGCDTYTVSGFTVSKGLSFTTYE